MKGKRILHLILQQTRQNESSAHCLEDPPSRSTIAYCQQISCILRYENWPFLLYLWCR